LTDLGLILKLQTDLPFQSAVVVFVDVPLGVTRVKVTAAPAAPAVPWKTVAVMLAVEFFIRGTVGTDTETERGSAGGGGGGATVGGFTVRFAVPSIDAEPVTATASTE
jgi:hypothetical protein